MRSPHRLQRSGARMLVLYGALSLLPVLLLGLGLGLSLHREARRRGLAEGRSEALLVAQTAVEPILDGRPLSEGLNPAEQDRLVVLVQRTVGNHDVLRLRLRDLGGRVVFTDDGSGLAKPPEDEVLRAASGATVALITRVNTDGNDAGPTGVQSVEVYQPVSAGSPARRVGVLEMYLPYAPIAADVSRGMRMVYVTLALGLAALWALLIGISWSMSRGLRRQVSINAFQARHDDLTGLPNRLQFQERIASALANARPIDCVAVAIVDLDRFKEINDTLGHHHGDLVLAGLADRLRNALAPHDTVARLGGDEFGIVLTGCADPTKALGALRSAITDELEISGLPISVEASVGFAMAPQDGDRADLLLQRADVAMYVAKAGHLGATRYEASLDHYDAMNLTLVAQLRRAIQDGQLVLNYQPKTTLVDGTTNAVETLVRWAHPELGLLPPDRFIPLAEQTDLIDDLTDWVLRRATSDIARLDLPALSVAVNVSARNLTRPDFATRVEAILRETGLPNGQLITEITETALLVDPSRTAGMLAELAEIGVRVSIDDFGSGQTSLGYLSALPIHELKIDKGFVADMLTNHGHAAIVRSIIDLGHNLGMQVVAEGVETADVAAAMRASTCDVAQGYFFARPMPISALASWLRSGRADRGQLETAPASS